MATISASNASGAWSTGSTWVGGSPPAQNDLINWERNATSSAVYVNLNVDYTAITQVNFYNNQGGTTAAGPMNISGAGATTYSTNIFTIGSSVFDIYVRANNSVDDGGFSAWNCNVVATSDKTIRKRGGGTWMMNNRSTSTVQCAISVLEGCVSIGDAVSGGLGTGSIFLDGSGVRLGGPQAAGTVTYTNPVVVRAADCIIGSRYTGGNWTGALAFPSLEVQGTYSVNFRDIPSSIGELRGNNASWQFTKTGNRSLTINGAAQPSTGFRGRVVVSGSSDILVFNADALKYATVSSSAGLAFQQPTHSLGNIVSGSNFAIGTRTFNTGYADTSAVFANVFTGSGAINKYGTGTWTLSGDNSGFTGSWGFYDGSVQAATSSNALGGPGRIHDVQATGQLQVASGLTVNNTGGNTYLRRTATDKGALYAASGTASYTTGTLHLRPEQPVEAASGATLTVNASTIQNESGYGGGIYKLGVGTVALNGTNYTYTGQTTVVAGTLSATNTLGPTKVALGDARLLNTQLGASTSLTVSTAFTTQATVESSVTSPAYANAVTIPTSSALTLKTENLAGGRPIPLLGTANVTVNGALVAPIGGNQRGRLVHGGNLTFGAGSLLRFSTPALGPGTLGTQSITGNLQLDAPTSVVMDASVYTAAGTYTLFRWTGAFSAAAPYSSAGQEQAAVTALLNVTPPVNRLLELTSGPTYVYGLNRIDVTLSDISTRGEQSITGDFDLAAETPIVLDAGVYNAPGKYYLFSWTGSFIYDTGTYGSPQTAVTALLNITPPAGRAVSAVTYNGTTKSITVTLS